MCVACNGVGGFLKRVEGGEHIKMITHRKTAAFMVFLYFLNVIFLLERRKWILHGISKDNFHDNSKFTEYFLG